MMIEVKSSKFDEETRTLVIRAKDGAVYYVRDPQVLWRLKCCIEDAGEEPLLLSFNHDPDDNEVIDFRLGLDPDKAQ